MTLATIGTGTLTVDNVSSNADWLGVNPTSGLGDYTVTVDRAGRPAGTYSATLTIDYTADGTAKSLDVPVSMQVSGAATGVGDTGFTWILLIDPDTGDAVQTTSARNQNGRYPYQFSGVQNGSYFVVAGTDSDNDGFLCDPGEACGGYPTHGQLSQIVVSGQDVHGIDFVTTYSSQPAGTAFGAGVGGSNSYSRFPVRKKVKME